MITGLKTGLQTDHGEQYCRVFTELYDLETCLFFIPSIGAPFSILSDETCFISIESNLLDDNLKLTFSTLMDLDRGFGELLSFEGDYDLGNGLNIFL